MPKTPTRTGLSTFRTSTIRPGAAPGGSMDIACHYLYVIDNLLDPSHVSSFAGAGTGNLPLDLEKLDDGVIVSRWVMNSPPPHASH